MYVYYTYASLQTTHHADLQVIEKALTAIGVPCVVMPQTVNVATITERQRAQLAMLDPECEGGANVLGMKVQ